MPTAPQTPDAERFAAEALPHLDRLFRVARRLLAGLGSRDEAADLVQETFLRAFRTFASFRPGTDSRAWLFTILYSVFSNRYRQRQRRPVQVSLEALEKTLHHELAAPTWEDPLTRLVAGRHGAGELVDRALAELPEEFRAAVALVDLGDASYEEAAAALGCPVGTVRSRLSRGRRLLAARLRDLARQGLPASGGDR
jgi:RNA polymerase sigma-70 factor, ECF subfamily